MLNLFQHPPIGTLCAMPLDRGPCVYILASARDNPHWADLGLGFEPPA